MTLHVWIGMMGLQIICFPGQPATKLNGTSRQVERTVLFMSVLADSWKHARCVTAEVTPTRARLHTRACGKARPLTIKHAARAHGKHSAAQARRCSGVCDFHGAAAVCVCVCVCVCACVCARTRVFLATDTRLAHRQRRCPQASWGPGRFGQNDMRAHPAQY